jgi:flagellar motility protein MotE (MotC chaperone)
MTHQYAKSIRKKLRELASFAHKRELSRALETLDRHFTQWRQQEIDCFELNDRIHSFHQKTSRELWKTYSSMEDDFLVCRAVKLGFLSKEDVPEKVAKAILLDRPVLE